MTAPRRLRCAIYTRKSTEEGLDQAFNSLDAQRAACAAYIESQKAEGWTMLPEHYDDGGYSGGTMERPALQRLLQAVQSGQVDIIVVYKIDRLSRSLSDFAKLVDIFDAHQVTLSSDTQIYELRRHPDLRVAGSEGYSVSLHTQCLFEIAQSVAAALDVQDVSPMQKSIEYGGGQHLIACHDLGPFPDGLVGRDQHRASAVAIGDEAEEEAGLCPVHRFEAHFIDHEQRRREILSTSQPGRRQDRVGSQQVQQFIEAVVLHGEALLDGLDAEADGQVRFTDTRWPLDEHGFGVAYPGAGGERLDTAALDGGLERVVEVRQGLSRRQARQLQRGAYAACLTPTEFGLEQLLEELMGGDRLFDGIAQQRIELLSSMRTAERGELIARPINVEFMS